MCRRYIFHIYWLGEEKKITREWIKLKRIAYLNLHMKEGGTNQSDYFKQHLQYELADFDSKLCD